MQRVESSEDIRNLLTLKTPEGPSLEYKRELDLTNRDARVEVLKDLTGMGNGGGNVVYGIAENPAVDDLPDSVQPLTDFGLLAQLEGIVRDAVRPPLLAEYHQIAWPGGYVLSVAVTRSPICPYMIEAYNQRRYHRRANRTTNPMSEQEVRDAYLLVARWRETRETVWSQHELPIRPPKAAPWLTFSAIPEGPLHDLVNPSTTHPHVLRLPESERWILDRADIGIMYENLRVWAEGYYAEESDTDASPFRVIRIFRDGAVGIAVVADSRLGAVAR